MISQRLIFAFRQTRREWAGRLTFPDPSSTHGSQFDDLACAAYAGAYARRLKLYEGNAEAEACISWGVKWHIFDLAWAGRHRALAKVIVNDGHLVQDLAEVLKDAFRNAVEYRHTSTAMLLAPHCDAVGFRAWCEMGHEASRSYYVTIWNKIVDAGVHPSITDALPCAA